MRVREDVELPLVVDRAGGRDLRWQVAEQLRAAIRAGSFGSGQRLPSSRVLAGHLGVSRATVTAALVELEGEGWLEARQGSGTYVSPALTGVRLEGAGAPAAVTAEPPAAHRTRGALLDLTPGRPDTSRVADAAWRRAWRDAAAGPVDDTDPPPAGLRALRRAVAEHVRRARGVACTAEDVLVTAGATDAIRLLADAVDLAGHRAVVEEPGYPTAAALLRRAGARLHPVPVDDHGLLTDRLADAPPDTRLLYLTPSHQYPIGGLLPVERRLAVLRWAAERSVLVVEDDYDGEFRFATSPVPALASLDTAGRVAYVGTLSKVVSPAVRTGYVVAAPEVVVAALAVRAETGTPVPAIVQHAMAGYLDSGGARRHIGRQRKVYAERRARLVRRLADLPGVTAVRGLDAGLHAVVSLAPDRAGATAVAAARRLGVVVSDLDDYRARPDPAAPALVIGYGHVTPAELDRALDVLAAVLG